MNIKLGDMVRVADAIRSSGSSRPLWSVNNAELASTHNTSGLKETGRFMDDDVAIVLGIICYMDSVIQNEALVLNQRGELGWVYSKNLVTLC